MAEARLPAGKTLAAFDFDSVPMVSKAQVMALASGDVWLNTGANLLIFGPPGGGKSHLSAAIGLALVENGWRVLFARTTDLVQRLQAARRELALEAAIAKLDRPVRTDRGALRAALDAHHIQSAVRRMGTDLSPGASRTAPQALSRDPRFRDVTLRR